MSPDRANPDAQATDPAADVGYDGLKRLLDIVATLFFLVLLGPLMLGLALLVAVTSKGPVFYRQKRVGRGGEEFTVLKFRSMRADAESASGPVWAKSDDPRSTPVGLVMRRTFLDELPQLFNVLAGQMSIVGPRPERQFFVLQFRETLPGYDRRHFVRPGLTGWAQAYGWRGDEGDIAGRTRHDLWYVDHRSFAVDAHIVWRTLLVMFRLIDGAPMEVIPPEPAEVAGARSAEPQPEP